MWMAASPCLSRVHRWADPRMNSTIDVCNVTRCRGVHLSVSGIDDGLPPGRKAPSHLQLLAWQLRPVGRVRDAYRTFEALLSRANDLGLFPEEMDPKAESVPRQLPQALTHIALIRSTLVSTLQQAEA